MKIMSEVWRFVVVKVMPEVWRFVVAKTGACSEDIFVASCGGQSDSETCFSLRTYAFYHICSCINFSVVRT